MGTAGRFSNAAKAARDYCWRADVPGRRIDWIALTLFFVVACGWSWFAARWGALRLAASLPLIHPYVLICFGPMLGALAASSVRRPETWPIGFRGLSKIWSMIALALPVLAMAIVGVDRFHVDPHVDAATIAISLVLAAIGEEIGWREWLYNALAGLPLVASAIMTWALWLVWHFTFIDITVDGLDPVMLLILLVASFVLAAVVRETRSSAVAAAWRGAFMVAVPLAALPFLVVLLVGVTCKAAGAARRATP